MPIFSAHRRGERAGLGDTGAGPDSQPSKNAQSNVLQPLNARPYFDARRLLLLYALARRLTLRRRPAWEAGGPAPKSNASIALNHKRANVRCLLGSTLYSYAVNRRERLDGEASALQRPFGNFRTPSAYPAPLHRSVLKASPSS